MSNKNAPFGARVVGKLGSSPQVGGVTEYEIASGASGNIFSGDLVKMTNTGTILVAAAGDEASMLSQFMFEGQTFPGDPGFYHAGKYNVTMTYAGTGDGHASRQETRRGER